MNEMLLRRFVSFKKKKYFKEGFPPHLIPDVGFSEKIELYFFSRKFPYSDLNK